jgi:M3 family oligoendopeptidase
MPKFQELVYERPNLEAIQADFNTLMDTFKNATSATEQNDIMSKINTIRNSFMTMATLCNIRYTINTLDEYYEKENDYMDEITPILEGQVSEFYDLLLASPFRKELEDKWGTQLFKIAELQAKTFKPEIIEDLQLENKLSSQYTKLRASAKIMFEGEERNLSQMEPFAQSKDRNVRIAAEKATTAFYETNEAAFDDIYDQLVKVRHRMAEKLGFENYVPVGYAKMLRSDYDHNMVANYRKQVLESVVPLSSALRQRQAKRLGLNSLKYYDEKLEFLSGNATPKGTPEEIVESGRLMYKEMSAETHAFFELMVENNLMDLVSKKGKAGGGYCTYLNDYKFPFIFSNCNGSSGDVDVLTHEAGHAFQVYSSSHFEIPEYLWPTSESAEIHSMSMEFLAWPWMNSFFKEETEKYKFSHLSSALLFIPYGVTVDEFQHFVYENPTATPVERKAKWREIEKKYLPHRDYEDNAFLERGGFWFKQLHIFQAPFYYIDYTLAQVCAMEFWSKARSNREQAWQDYLRLCQAGGSRSFLGLVELADLHNPFVDGTIKHIVAPISEWIANVDDSNF